MIDNFEKLETIFKIAKMVKKPLVKIYPDGRVIGTDEQFASLNILESININNMIYSMDLEIPYIFKMTELSAFMREEKDMIKTVFGPHMIFTINKNGTIKLDNHLELNYNIDDVYNKVILSKDNKLLHKVLDSNQFYPEMYSMKVSDGSKMFNIDGYLMTSFNSIHPANKSDVVNIYIRDYDEFSYITEFVIFKKKDNYTLHEYLRFRKI